MSSSERKNNRGGLRIILATGEIMGRQYMEIVNAKTEQQACSGSVSAILATAVQDIGSMGHGPARRKNGFDRLPFFPGGDVEFTLLSINVTIEEAGLKPSVPEVGARNIAYRAEFGSHV
jgi:hypothetical protein